MVDLYHLISMPQHDFNIICEFFDKPANPIRMKYEINELGL
jgi:hypothetical protein